MESNEESEEENKEESNEENEEESEITWNPRFSDNLRSGVVNFYNDDELSDLPGFMSAIQVVFLTGCQEKIGLIFEVILYQDNTTLEI